MKTIKIYATCRSTERPLYYCEISWLDNNGDLFNTEGNQSSEGGFYEFKVPDYVTEIYVRNKTYSSEKYTINLVGSTSIMAKLKRNTSYNN